MGNTGCASAPLYALIFAKSIQFPFRLSLPYTLETFIGIMYKVSLLHNRVTSRRINVAYFNISLFSHIANCDRWSPQTISVSRCHQGSALAAKAIMFVVVFPDIEDLAARAQQVESKVIE
jgi:hypothetical protein